MAGPGGNRIRRRHHPLLVACVCTLGADARRHQRHVRPDDMAHGFRLFRRADDAAHAGCFRLFGTRQHQRMRVIFIACLAQVRIVHGGQHRDTQQAEVRALGRGHGGAHGLG